MKFGFTKFRLIVVVLLSSGIGLVIWKHEGILKRISDQRAGAHLTNAIVAGKEGDWKQSEQLSLAAWQLKEGDPEILRQLYQSAKRLRSRHLLYAAGALFDHPEATPEDRIDVIFLHLQIGDLVSTKKLLAALTPEELQTPDAMEAGVRFLLIRGENLRALPLVEKLQQSRGNLEDTLLAARVIARIPTEKNKATTRAQAMIESLFFQDEDPQIALAALPILRSIPKTLWETDRFRMARQRISSLRGKGNHAPADLDFLAAEIRMAASEGNRDAIIDEMIVSHRESNLERLASWLLELGETDRLDSLMTPDLIEASSVLYLTRARSLLQREDWKATQDFLATPHPQIPHTIIHAMRAVAATGMGQNANSRDQWERALRQATLLSGRGGLLELARMASAAGAEDIQNRALTEALRRPSVVPMPATDVSFLFSHLAAEDDPENLLVISRNLLQSEPDNPMLLNNVLWLELVMQKNSGNVRSDQIKDLVERFPGISTLRATFTLALLTEEKLEEAGNAAEAMIAGVDPERFSPTDRAVLALVHRKVGTPSLTEFSGSIDWTGMMDIERSFFQAALANENEQNL